MASAIRFLTMEDVADILHMKGTMLDILAATAQRASQILQQQPPPPPLPAAAKKTKKQLKRERAARPSKPSAAKKRKITKCRSDDRQPSLPPPPLPEEFKRAIQDLARGGDATPARLVIQKFLFATDVAANNNRFSIPLSRVGEEFLTEEEKGHVGNKKYLEMKMIAPSLTAETVKFTRWDMAKGNGCKTSSCYVINGKWNHIVEANGLEEGMEVQLWSFRIHQDLCFALVTLS